MVNLEISDRDDEYKWAAFLTGNLFVCDKCGQTLHNEHFGTETGDECTYDSFGLFAKSRGWFAAVRNVADSFEMGVLCPNCGFGRL